MDDRRRTLAAITLIVGFLVLVAVIVGVLVSGKTVLSPIPDDNSAIKIIFITPEPTQIPETITDIPVHTPVSTSKPAAKPKPTATTKPKPTSATPSATPEP